LGERQHIKAFTTEDAEITEQDLPQVRSANSVSRNEEEEVGIQKPGVAGFKNELLCFILC
jgi:hypothetical protein